MNAIILINCTAEDVCRILTEVKSNTVSISGKDILDGKTSDFIPVLPLKVEKGRWTGTRYVYSQEENDLIAQMVKQGYTNSDIRKRMIENNPDYRFSNKQIENKVGNIRRTLSREV